MAFSGEPDSPLPFPIIADHNRELSVLLGMLDPDEVDKDGMPLTARCVSPASSSWPAHLPFNHVWGRVHADVQYAGYSAFQLGALPNTQTHFDV